jgi:hypothetical protein
MDCGYPVNQVLAVGPESPYATPPVHASTQRLRIAAAKTGWYLVLLGTGLAGLSGAMLIGFALLDHTLRSREALGYTILGLGLVALLALALALRARWYEQHAIYRSWSGLLEAMHASLWRPPLAREELEELRRYTAERHLEGVAVRELYEHARDRRGSAPAAEQEFRWLADLLFRYVTNVHHVSAHTILTDYTPTRYRAGALLALGWGLAGAAMAVAGVAVMHGSAMRVLAGALGCWTIVVSIGLYRRWRWALVQALAGLALVEGLLVYLAVAGRLAHPAWGLAFYVPLFSGIYLFRRRRWFTPD